MNKNPSIKFLRPTRRCVLLTGATGLVGSYLMRDLFSRGCQLAVIARPNKRQDSEQRIESIMHRWETEMGKNLPRPIVFTGDVCQDKLGLDSDSIDWIRAHCGSVLHSAAALQFDGATAQDEPWRTNLGGTRNVLDLAQHAGINEFHYVSTAYVCGKRPEKVFESDLDCGQEFRNDYERSKFAAEKLVHAANHLTSKTIYRPTVIVGDSNTGFTSTYHGLFLYLRLIATLVPLQRRNAKGIIETPIRVPMDGNEPRNLVPVDWVSQVISQLVCNPAAHGKTFHLSPDECVTARKVIEYCYAYFNSAGVEFCGPNAGNHSNSDFAARFFENASIYESYLTSDPTFDKTNVNQFAGQFACPPIDQDVIFRFLDFGKANRWGKSKSPKKNRTGAVVEYANIIESALEETA